MFALAFFVSFLVTVTPSLASHSIVGRQAASNCPDNGVSFQKNFTLFAVSKADPSNQTPLALGSLSSSGSRGWIGTATTMPVIISSDFVMVAGGMYATTQEGNITGVSSSVTAKSGMLSFTLVENHEPSYPTGGVYCVLSDPDPNAQVPDTLAVNGDGENFSLCQLSESNASESLVVYNAINSTYETAEYDFETCTDITVAVCQE